MSTNIVPTTNWNWIFKFWSKAFCFFGRHNFKAVDLEWNWVILECSCGKTTTQKLP